MSNVRDLELKVRQLTSACADTARSVVIALDRLTLAEDVITAARDMLRTGDDYELKLAIMAYDADKGSRS